MAHPPAVVGTVRCRIALQWEDAVAEAECRMRTAADRVLADGGFIGHIKAIVEEDSRKCRISITGEEEADRQWLDPDGICGGDCVFIVFGLTCQQLKEILQDTFSDLIL